MARVEEVVQEEMCLDLFLLVQEEKGCQTKVKEVTLLDMEQVVAEQKEGRLLIVMVE